MNKKFEQAQFITFEGCEGSGKSTQSKLLHEYLLSKRIKAIHTREIGGTAEAESIRSLILHSSELLPMSELLLVMAARYEHISKVILPALQEDTWVVCDRFIDSTACYQGGEQDITIDDVYSLHQRLMPNAIMPNITFFMDLDPTIGLSRAINRGNTNKFEDKNLAHHKIIYDRFKHIAEARRERIITINAEGKSIQETHELIVKMLLAPTTTSTTYSQFR